MSEIDPRWQSNIRALVQEHLSNGSNGSAALLTPWRITLGKLYEVGKVAERLNDPELNLLMCELAIFTVGDGYHKDYNPKVVDKLRQQVAQIKAAEQSAKELK